MNDMNDSGPVRVFSDLDAENERLRTKLAATKAVLGYREDELLRLKGPCSSTECRLHYAHSGPCVQSGYEGTESLD